MGFWKSGNSFDYYTETPILEVILFEESIALIKI